MPRRRLVRWTADSCSIFCRLIAQTGYRAQKRKQSSTFWSNFRHIPKTTTKSPPWTLPFLFFLGLHTEPAPRSTTRNPGMELTADVFQNKLLTSNWSSSFPFRPWCGFLFCFGSAWLKALAEGMHSDVVHLPNPCSWGRLHTATHLTTRTALQNQLLLCQAIPQ